MKTLRIVRNIAALFILFMALLAARSGPIFAHADKPQGVKLCSPKPGYNCEYNLHGNCVEQKCNGHSYCNGFGCVAS